MSKKVLCKFKCNSVKNFENQKEVSLNPVMGGSEENKSFSKYTPGGELRMMIDNETEAADLFTPGKDYFMTIEAAPAPGE